MSNISNLQNNVRGRINHNKHFSGKKRRSFAFYFVISWLLINWKTILFLVFDPIKAQSKIDAITSLFIPKGFCGQGVSSAICWFSSSWNPDNQLITFNLILPLLLALFIVVIITFIINPVDLWFNKQHQKSARKRSNR